MFNTYPLRNIISHLLWKCMEIMSLNIFMMFKHSSMFRRPDLINFIKSLLFLLFQQMARMLIIKQLVCMKILLIFEVMDAHFVVGMVKAAPHLEIDLLVNFMENMGMLWLIFGIVWWEIHYCLGFDYILTLLICLKTNLKLPHWSSSPGLNVHYTQVFLSSRPWESILVCRLRCIALSYLSCFLLAF